MANPFTSKAEDGFLENLKEADFLELSQNIGEAIRDEWLGIDDFRRAYTKFREGNLLGALKSMATGTFEIGGTAAMFLSGGAAAPVVSGAKAVSTAGKGAKLAKGLRAAKALREVETAAEVARGVETAAEARKGATATRKIYNILRPRTIDEKIEAAARMRAGGKRGILGEARVADEALLEQARREVREDLLKLPPQTRKEPTLPGAGFEEMATTARLPRRRFEEVGSGAGGAVGSALRGVVQLGGGMPQNQGTLAVPAARARALGQTPTRLQRAGAFASGKTLAVAQRTGTDPFDWAGRMAAGPEMTPYGITQQQYNELSSQLTPQDMALFLQALEQAQLERGAQ